MREREENKSVNSKASLVLKQFYFQIWQCSKSFNCKSVLVQFLSLLIILTKLSYSYKKQQYYSNEFPAPKYDSTFIPSSKAENKRL